MFLIKEKSKNKKQKVFCKRCRQFYYKLKHCYYTFLKLHYKDFKSIKKTEKYLAKVLLNNKDLINKVNIIYKIIKKKKTNNN